MCLSSCVDSSDTLLLLGVNPQSIRGSKTGVFVGMAPSEAGVAWSSDIEDLTGHELVGCMLSMIAHRLSYFFDFTGV